MPLIKTLLRHSPHPQLKASHARDWGGIHSLQAFVLTAPADPEDRTASSVQDPSLQCCLSLPHSWPPCFTWWCWLHWVRLFPQYLRDGDSTSGCLTQICSLAPIQLGTPLPWRGINRPAQYLGNTNWKIALLPGAQAQTCQGVGWGWGREILGHHMTAPD